VNLLFDQNISPKIIKTLPKDFSNSCQHVRCAGLEDTADFDIFSYAKNQNYSIVTFDADFVDLNALYGTPPKVIYLNTGNLTTRNIIELLQNNFLKITQYLNSDSDEILELIKDS
jgi:predicted nuclease of predicted toxin-antitoxin system